jgi:iron complex transport system ATP-binding protein
VSAAALDLINLAVGYRCGRDAVPLAEQLNAQLQPGELVCMLGVNGAGKSTLLRTIAGLQPPLAGRVLLDGDQLAELTPAQRACRLAMVFTDRSAAGHLSATTLVALGRHPYTNWTGRLRDEDRSAVSQALAAVHATELADRMVDELSDGEKQKVFIARALAQEPRLLLLDEPTAFLDLPRRMEVVRHLRSLAVDQQCAVLLTTHDVELALRIADRLWLLHQGALTTGAPEDLVLDGRMSEMFADRTVRFEAVSGTFSLVPDPVGTAVIDGGTPLVREWTERALVRIGYVVGADAANDSTVHIRIGDDDKAPRNWTLTRRGVSESVGSLAAVVGELR